MKNCKFYILTLKLLVLRQKIEKPKVFINRTSWFVQIFNKRKLSYLKFLMKSDEGLQILSPCESIIFVLLLQT